MPSINLEQFEDYETLIEISQDCPTIKHIIDAMIAALRIAVNADAITIRALEWQLEQFVIIASRLVENFY